jgi:hypothetical protein
MAYIPMEQEEETSTMSPFWVPKTTTNHHRLRRTYSLLQTTTSFLVLLIITTIVLTFIVVPTLKSFTSNIFKPQTIKHSWDYLNLLLVLFAVVCGFLTKNDTNETQTPRFDSYNNNNNHRRSFSNPETPPSWYDDSNRSFNRLRAVGSVPDLRQRTVFVADDDRYRFYDDTSVHFRYRNLRFEDELNRETVTSGERILELKMFGEMLNEYMKLKRLRNRKLTMMILLLRIYIRRHLRRRNRYQR